MQDENAEKRGIIKDVIAQGGILTLVVERDGKLERLHGDNGQTVRSLRAIFGPDITQGFMLDVSKLRGREVGYDTDDFGTLAYITE